MKPEELVINFLAYAVFLFSTVVHEASHALSAKVMGDDTAADEGLVSIDPLPHIRREPIGMVLLPIFGVLMGGYIVGWGSAPYDPTWAARYPRKKALMALAGPAANLLLALIALLFIQIGLGTNIFEIADRWWPSHLIVAEKSYRGLDVLLSLLLSMNLFLLCFNLLPVPPLDGSSVITLFLPARLAQKAEELRYNPLVRQIGFFFLFACGSQLIYPWVFSILRAILL